MKHSILLLMLSWLCTTTLYSQHYFDTYTKALDVDDIDLREKSVDSLLNTLRLQNKMQALIEVAHKFSIAIRNENIEKAIKYASLEVAVYEHLSINTSAYRNALYNLGRFYATDSQLSKSLLCLKKITNSTSKDKFSALAYCEIGENYYELGDYYRSIIYYEKGIEELTILKESKRLVSSYLNLSVVYEELETKTNLAKMLACLNKVDSLSTIIPLKQRDVFILNNSYADYYNNDKSFNFQLAKKYYNKTIKKATILEDTDVLHAAYNNLGILYNKVRNDSAQYFLNKALKIDANNGNTFNILASYEFLNENYDEALKAINHSITIYVGDTAIVDGDFQINKLSQDIDLHNLLLTVYRKATILIKIYEQEGDKKILAQALKSINLADEIINLLYNKSIETSSKLYWRKEASSVYALAIYVSEILKNQEGVFLYMEKNKALMLTEAIYKNLQRAALPKEYREKEFAFRKTITTIETLLLTNNTKAIRDSLFFSKIDYQNFLDTTARVKDTSFSTKVPAILTLDQIKKNLKNDQVVISYFWNTEDEFSNALFALWITKDKVISQKIEDTRKLETLINDLKVTFKKPISTISEKEMYSKKSFEIYTMLFSTEEIKTLYQNKHLIILSDGALQNIPFEILTTNNKPESYLIKNNSISYANSMSYLQNNALVKREAKNNFIGFAPVNYTYDNLSTLSRSKDEVAIISSQFNGDVFFNVQSTKVNFMDISSNYKIIHLAAHANANQTPWVAFSDDKLYLNEIYTSKNQAELVVLSACNTAQGEIAKGEGILSLSRGFFYAGANSVLSNGWEANDKSTSEIMQSFYSYLDEGETKAVSLQKAKIDYLNTHSLSELSPHYWASFMLVGDAGNIKLMSNFSHLIQGAIIVLALLFFLFWFFYLKKQ